LTGNSNDKHFLCEFIGDSIPERYDNKQHIFSISEGELISGIFWEKDTVPVPTYEGIPSQINIMKTRTVPKIFRENYELQEESLVFKAGKEEIPDIFRNPGLEDITSRYLECTEVEVAFDKPAVPRKYAYLCCFNQDRNFPTPVDWAPVRHGRAGQHSVT
jgi:hypothetical protein